VRKDRRTKKTETGKEEEKGKWLLEEYKWERQGAKGEKKKGGATGGIISGVKLRIKEKGHEKGEEEGCMKRKVHIGNK
jgi:hypothetical protein